MLSLNKNQTVRFMVLFLIQTSWKPLEFDSGFPRETVSRSRSLWENMRPYNHIKAKHASLTLKYYTQMDMVSQTSKRERERLYRLILQSLEKVGGCTERKESRKKHIPHDFERNALRIMVVSGTFSNKANYKQKHLTMWIILQTKRRQSMSSMVICYSVHFPFDRYIHTAIPPKPPEGTISGVKLNCV